MVSRIKSFIIFVLSVVAAFETGLLAISAVTMVALVDEIRERHKPSRYKSYYERSSR